MTTKITEQEKNENEQNTKNKRNYVIYYSFLNFLKILLFHNSLKIGMNKELYEKNLINDVIFKEQRGIKFL